MREYAWECTWDGPFALLHHGFHGLGDLRASSSDVVDLNLGGTSGNLMFLTV